MTSPSRQQTNPVQLLLLVVVALLTLTLWRQRTDTELIEKEYQDLARQKRELEQKKVQAAAPAVPPAAAASPDNTAAVPAQPVPLAPAADVRAETSAPAPELVQTPTGLAPAPVSKGLALAGTHVTPTEGGLRTTLQFNPTTSDPLGLVAIVVRLPPDGESKILELVPIGSMKYTGIAGRVAEDGKFAVFQGTPESVAALEFALSVSGPAVADVRGTTGIGAFDLHVGPTGASATPK